MSGKLALKYQGAGIEAMKKVANASKDRSLADFQAAVKEYSSELEQDRIVAKHLQSLYQTMLEQNLCRIIEPYNRVQVSNETKDFHVLQIFCLLINFQTKTQFSSRL